MMIDWFKPDGTIQTVVTKDERGALGIASDG